jgi:palmitoyltransferase
MRGCLTCLQGWNTYECIFDLSTRLEMSTIHWHLPFSIPSVEDLAIPAVSVLIIFLAYTSQYLFYYIEPGPLSRDQAIWFNVFVFALWVCYDSACTVDPGRKGWVQKVVESAEDSGDEEDGEGKLTKGTRWCKKCDAVKPPRAHHCKQCERHEFPSTDPRLY